ISPCWSAGCIPATLAPTAKPTPRDFTISGSVLFSRWKRLRSNCSARVMRAFPRKTQGGSIMSNVLFGGLHRGAQSIVKELKDDTTRLYEPGWLLADPKADRAAQMAGVLRHRFATLS